VQVEYFIGEPYSNACQEISPSKATRNGKRKQSVHISQCKQLEVMVTLPCILEGVIILCNIVGCVEKIRYSCHDVIDKEKF
jgi:hypothetical protein